MTSRPVILIADDDPQILNVLRLCLEEDFELVLAEDGVQAVERTMDLRPDLILMDVKMPRLDGWEAIRRIRKQGIGVPIVVMTGFTELLDDTIIRRLDIAECLAKPFGIQNILALIQDLTSKETKLN